MKRPLVVLCLSFCGGIWFSVFAAEIPFAVFFVLSVVCSALGLSLIKHRRRFAACLCLAVFFLGAALLKNAQTAAPRHIVKQLPLASGQVWLKGMVCAEPRIEKRRTEFLFAAQELKAKEISRRVCGKVLVKASGSHDFKYGQLLLLKGKLHRPYNFPLSIRLGYRDYLARKQIYCLMSVGKAGEVRDLKENRGNPLLRFSFWLKREMEAAVDKNLPAIPASVLNAMLLGERKSVPQFFNEAMVKTGTVHILVVSGFNVGIVAFIALTLLKALRLSRRFRLWLTIFVLVFYCLLTGASTPVVRATIMGLVIIFGYLFEREPDIYNSLALAALVILGLNPLQIMEVGFQLSFASVLAIAGIYLRLKKYISTLIPANLTRINADNPATNSRPFALKVFSRCFHILVPLFCVSLSAWLGTAGLVAYYFGIISLVTVLANILIVPLTSFITACGFALVITAKVLPAASFFFAKSCEATVWLMWRINWFLLKIKGAYFCVKSFPAVYLLGYYLLLAALFVKLPKIDKSRQV